MSVVWGGGCYWGTNSEYQMGSFRIPNSMPSIVSTMWNAWYGNSNWHIPEIIISWSCSNIECVTSFMVPVWTWFGAIAATSGIIWTESLLIYHLEHLESTANRALVKCSMSFFSMMYGTRLPGFFAEPRYPSWYSRVEPQGGRRRVLSVMIALHATRQHFYISYSLLVWS